MTGGLIMGVLRSLRRKAGWSPYSPKSLPKPGSMFTSSRAQSASLFDMSTLISWPMLFSPALKSLLSPCMKLSSSRIRGCCECAKAEIAPPDRRGSR